MKHTGFAVLVLFICWYTIPVLGEQESDEIVYTGEIEVGGRLVEQNGDEAKFEEYRDMGEGLYGRAEVQANKENIHINLDADNIGRDDQQYDLRGGKYGKYKMSISYDGISHSYTKGAKSYLNGVGSAYLTDSGNIDDPSLWQRFDYDRQHKNSSFKGEYIFDMPYYVELGGSRKDTDGIYPLGGPSGTELPVPVDWEESNWFVGGGYQGESLTAGLRADISDFDNKKNMVSWDDHTTSLAPDSEYYKFSGKVVYRNPFLSSRVGLKASLSKKENSVNMALMDSSASGIYNGEVATTNVAADWDFVPVSYADVKFYVKYSDTDDGSDTLTINSVTITPYDHEKLQSGFDVVFSFLRKNFLDVGYRYTDADRSSRTDSDSTIDNLAFLQYRNRFFERFMFKARYEYLSRDGKFNGTDGYEYSDDTDSYLITSMADDGTRRYDVADQTRNNVSLEAEYFFTEDLSGAVKYSWENRDYKDTIYGLTETKRQEACISGGYSLPEIFYATIYLGYEVDENEMATTRNWAQDETFDTITYGVSAEYLTLEKKLRCLLSWDHSMVDGSTDFYPTENDYIDLTDVDDCNIQHFKADGIYELSRTWHLKLTYIFEKFDLDDGQYDGYIYLPSGAVLTGAYANQDYDAHIVSLGAVYRF